MRESFSQAPVGEREGAFALGATRWGMIRSVVLPFGQGGMIGGTMLGLGRAMGEHCLEQARAAGYLGMQFNAVVASNHTAIKLWSALGFSTIGTVPRAFRHPTDGLVDLLIMYRDL